MRRHRLTRRQVRQLVALRHEARLAHLCVYCGRRIGNTRDHVVPKAKGGSDEAWNIVRACEKCNHQKADKMPEEWREELLR